MKKKCAMARDLMPLVIDHAASEESAEFVQEHMEECDECREQFAQMQQEIASPVSAEQGENAAAFSHSMRQLKHRQRIRCALVCALCLLLAAALAFCALEVYLGHLIYNREDLPAEDAQIALFQLPTGEVQILIRRMDGLDICYGNFTTATVPNADGSQTLYIRATQPRIRALAKPSALGKAALYGYYHANRLQVIDGVLYKIDSYGSVNIVNQVQDEQGENATRFTVNWREPVRISEIRYGDPDSSDNVPLYAQGDAIRTVEANEYIGYLDEAFGENHSRSYDFYADDTRSTFAVQLAEAYIRGDELPALPAEMLPQAEYGKAIVVLQVLPVASPSTNVDTILLQPGSAVTSSEAQ